MEADEFLKKIEGDHQRADIQKLAGDATVSDALAVHFEDGSTAFVCLQTLASCSCKMIG